RCAPEDESAVEAECRAQLEAFRRLLGRDPTHLDSHQHIHMSEPLASVAGRLGAELGVPLRGRGIRYEGGFYGQSGKGEPLPEAISAQSLIELIVSLPGGWTELGCHPGLRMGEESSYGAEREREVEALCDPGVRERIQSEAIELRSFAQRG
ncbi:MAG TPA: ChbG/HpnK family deacetylase, partial [Solirubrobacterales bacterium]|nr:ChbG/HpnK family deacetylase [Solirubrobacterales bacterium]